MLGRRHNQLDKDRPSKDRQCPFSAAIQPLDSLTIMDLCKFRSLTI